MIVTYDIYRRYADRDRAGESADLNTPIENDLYYGRRYVLVENFNSFTITLNRQKRNKFSIKGTAIGEAPFVIGDTVIFYRNAELFFTGLVASVKVECKDVTAGALEWEAEGEDESILFDWRIILTDHDESKGFQDLSFNEEIFDKCEDYARDRMIHYIRNCFDRAWTSPARAINDMNFPKSSAAERIPAADRGENALSAYRLDKLSKVLEEIGKDAGLFPQYRWDPISGKKEMSIPIQKDRSGMVSGKTYNDNELVVISPEFGNVEKWSVTHKMPVYNAVWVVSGEYLTTDELPVIVPEYTFDNGFIVGVKLGCWDFTVDPNNNMVTNIEINPERKAAEEQRQQEWEERQAEYEMLNQQRKRRILKEKMAEYGFDVTHFDDLTDEQLKELGCFDWIDDVDFGTMNNRVWVYAEDTESIKKYGRIEQIINKSDISVTEFDKDIPDEEALTEEDVIGLLEDEARKALQENAEKDKYSITMTQTDDLVFMRDWQCGDKVKVVIDGKEFASSIETVVVTFTDLTETVTATIGAVEEGIFSQVFSMMHGIERRIDAEEEI